MARPKEFDEDLVLDRAVNVFWCRGYEATSIQNLVEAMGINRASLYDTYGDKFALYQKALARYRQTQQDELCHLLDQDRPAEAIIRTLLNHVIEESRTDPDYKGCFMINAAMELANREPAIASLVNDNQQLFEANLEKMVERGQTEGMLTRQYSAAELAHYLFSVINGLKVVGKTSPNTTKGSVVIALVMRALRTDGNGH